MNKLQGLPFYDFSVQNKYAPNYNVAYKRAVQAQNEVIEAKHSPYAKPAEIEKWENDWKRWKSEVKDLSILAKVEENCLKKEQKNGLGMNIDFLA